MNLKRSVLYVLAATFLIGVFIIYMVIAERGDGQLRVAFLDVGQGDAVFIETPKDFQILIDGGRDTSVLRELQKQLPLYDRSIDMVIATHGDADHIGALPRVFNRFDIGHVITNGADVTGAVMEAFESSYIKEGAVHITAQRGQTIHLDSGITITILFPDRSADLERNTGSVIAQLSYEDTSFLFTGDAPQSVEEYLTALGTSTLQSDVLKVGHHGSDTSSAEVFLQFVNPSYAVIQAGKDNQYGHPHEEVVMRLANIGAHVICTCEHGSVVFKSDGGSVRRIR